MSDRPEMVYEATSDYRFGSVVCICGTRIRVSVTQYRVECPCGKSAILSELVQKSKRESLNG